MMYLIMLIGKHSTELSEGQQKSNQINRWKFASNNLAHLHKKRSVLYNHITLTVH